jgi:hypothetical protein
MVSQTMLSRHTEGKMNIKIRKNIVDNTFEVYENDVVKIVGVSYADADARARFKWNLSALDALTIKNDYEVDSLWNKAE